MRRCRRPCDSGMPPAICGCSPTPRGIVTRSICCAGHKGPGYQAQIAETCHPDNEVQLITCVLPQTAAVTDEKALAPVLEDLQASGLLPEELLVDTLYPSDENVQQG